MTEERPGARVASGDEFSSVAGASCCCVFLSSHHTLLKPKKLHAGANYLLCIFFVWHWLEYVDSGIESEKRERERQLGKERKARGGGRGREREIRGSRRRCGYFGCFGSEIFVFFPPHFASRQFKKTWRREFGSLGTKPLAHMQ